jgi:TatD DNase family protein
VEPGDRIKLFISFAEDRLKKFQYELNRQNPDRRRVEILNSLMNDYAGCVDDAADQIALARETGKPVVIHTREAWEDTIRLLGPGMRGIFHCFSGGPEELDQVLELGFHVSFAGIVTFPNARRLQEAARRTPLDRILVETDAPYLAPVPRRGKRNEPSFVVETARQVAELKGISMEQLAAATTENFARLLLPEAKLSEYTGIT